MKLSMTTSKRQHHFVISEEDSREREREMEVKDPRVQRKKNPFELSVTIILEEGSAGDDDFHCLFIRGVRNL